MKKLWEELNTLNLKTQCSCVCICGAKDSVHKAEQDRRLIQFLMGLNDVYTVVRGNILMMNPLPSMAQSFSLLIQEEKQREFKPTGRMPMDSTSLNAGVFNNKVQTGRTFRTNYQNNTHTGSNYYQGSSSGRNAIICDFCKKTGHIKEKCYKLHGYPQHNNNQGYRTNGGYTNGQDYRQNNQNLKGKRVVANVHSDTDMVSTHGEEQVKNNTLQNAITREQCGQLMDLLQHFQNENTGEDSGPFNEEASGAW